MSCVVGTSTSQVYLTRSEALTRAFPSATTIERKTVFLSDEQVRAIQHRGRTKVESKVVTYYQATAHDSTLGYAFLETQNVRTMPATYMVIVNPDASVERIEILAFYEPEDYLPPSRWLRQMSNKQLDDDLWLKRGIRTISGATLTAQAIVDGTRRVLATFDVMIGSKGAVR
jgi:hypothetical protein